MPSSPPKKPISFADITEPRGFAIETEVPGVILKEALGTPDESAAYLRMLERNRAEINTFFQTLDSEHTTVKQVSDSFGVRKAHVLTFLLYRDNTMVGKLHLIDPNHSPHMNFPDLENLYLGGWTDIEARGGGVGPAVRRALAFYVLNNGWCEKVYLQSHPDNHPSHECAKKAGFEFIGVTPENGILVHDFKFNPNSTLLR